MRNDDLLRWNRLVVFLLDFIASPSAPPAAPATHGDVATGAGTDQAADSPSRSGLRPESADAGVMIGCDRRIGDLFDPSGANLNGRLRSRGGAGDQAPGLSAGVMARAMNRFNMGFLSRLESWSVANS